MHLVRILHATRELGRGQGYIPLYIRDDFITMENGKRGLAMVSAWTPTPEELEQINAGAPIYLSIYGVIGDEGVSDLELLKASNHPPVMLSVGPVPLES